MNGEEEMTSPKKGRGKKGGKGAGKGLKGLAKGLGKMGSALGKGGKGGGGGKIGGGGMHPGAPKVHHTKTPVHRPKPGGGLKAQHAGLSEYKSAKSLDPKPDKQREKRLRGAAL